MLFCNSDTSLEPELAAKAIKMINFESENQVLEVRDLKLAELLQLQPGRFYVYYRPSVACGFQYATFFPLASVEMTQALVKDFYRGELTIDKDQLRSITLSPIFTETEANRLFSSVFETTYNEEFNFNPNMRQLRRKLRGEEPSPRPILFIYYKQFFMEYFQSLLKQTLHKNGYDQMFDLYYCDDPAVASALIETNKFEDPIPVVYLFDPSQQTSVASARVVAEDGAHVRQTAVTKRMQPLIP